MWTEDLVQIQGDRSDAGGKYVVARLDIPEDTVILTEAPLVLGPKQCSSIVCVQCCSVMSQLQLCSRCGLTLCQDCADNVTIHKQECDIFVHNSKRFTISSEQDSVKTYSLITILRLLLTNRVDEFESHSKAREGSPIWMYVESTVVPVLSCLVSPSTGATLFTEDMIHAAAGVLDTNTFELKTVDDAGEVERLGRALYCSASLLNNNCQPSCRKMFDGSKIRVVTSRLVQAGEELSICYTGLLQPTFIRQTVFRQTKHFSCCCDRCQDPTELGTHLGNIHCSECEESLSPDHVPEQCRLHMNQEEISQMLERCEVMVRRLNTSSDCIIWLSLANKLSKLLTKHNFIMVQFKEKFLNHVEQCNNEDCRNSRFVDQYLEELNWLRSVLDPKAPKLKEKKKDGVNSKVLFGKDIVKQMLATKLSKHVETETLIKLTK